MEHLIGEFWVILLIMEPPFQTETLVQIESKSAHKASDVSAFKAVLEPLGGRVVFICTACVRDNGWWNRSTPSSSLSEHPASRLWALCSVSNMLKWNWCGVNHYRLRTKLPMRHPSPLCKQKSGNIDKWFIWSAVWIFKIGLREEKVNKMFTSSDVTAFPIWNYTLSRSRMKSHCIHSLLQHQSTFWR